MNILERLKTRFDPRIVQPDEMAREAHGEIERLRAALEQIAEEHPQPFDKLARSREAHWSHISRMRSQNDGRGM
ncbi:MAG: hypothetical protein ACOYOJ_21220 [Alsobacter sp.]